MQVACKKAQKVAVPRHAEEVLHGRWRKDDVCSLPVVCDHERSAPRLEVLADELQQGQDLSSAPRPSP